MILKSKDSRQEDILELNRLLGLNLAKGGGSIKWQLLQFYASSYKHRWRGRIGGNAWESNPPRRFLIPPTGFEDRAAHQRPTRFRDGRGTFAPLR